MTKTDRIKAAASVAIERARAMLDASPGLIGLRIDVKFDRDGNPNRAVILPELEISIVTRKLSDYDFNDTTH